MQTANDMYRFLTQSDANTVVSDANAEESSTAAHLFEMGDLLQRFGGLEFFYSYLNPFQNLCVFYLNTSDRFKS